jgi:hypothetical protein
MIYFVTPESPRYLVIETQSEKACLVFAKYMAASGDIGKPVLRLMLDTMFETPGTNQVKSIVKTSKTKTEREKAGMDVASAAAWAEEPV